MLAFADVSDVVSRGMTVLEKLRGGPATASTASNTSAMRAIGMDAILSFSTDFADFTDSATGAPFARRSAPGPS